MLATTTSSTLLSMLESATSSTATSALASGLSGAVEGFATTDYNGSPVIIVTSSLTSKSKPVLITPKNISNLLGPEDIIAEILPKDNSSKGGSSLFSTITEDVEQIQNPISNFDEINLETDFFEESPLISKLEGKSILLLSDEDSLLEIARAIEGNKLQKVDRILIPKNSIQNIPQSIEHLVVEIGEDLNNETIVDNTLNVSFTDNNFNRSDFLANLSSPVKDLETLVTGTEPELKISPKLSVETLKTPKEVMDLFSKIEATEVLPQKISLSKDLLDLAPTVLKNLEKAVEAFSSNSLRIVSRRNDLGNTIITLDNPEKIIVKSAKNSIKNALKNKKKEKEADEPKKEIVTPKITINEAPKLTSSRRNAKVSKPTNKISENNLKEILKSLARDKNRAKPTTLAA